MKGVFITLLMLALSGCWRDRALIINVPIKAVEQSLKDTVPALMHKNDVIGLSVVILRANKISVSASFGYADLASKRKVNKQTVYRAASLGKPVFAYIVAALAKTHILDLDKPLYLYSGVKAVKNDTRSKEITARMVLSHTTGLPNLGKNSAPIFYFKPGEDFMYSGAGYQYLQRVIEMLTQKSLDELALEMVFKPLSMTASSYTWRNEYEGVISNSYGDGDGAKKEKDQGKATLTKNQKSAHAAWSLYTTAEDYSKFVAHIMRTSKESGSIASLLLKPSVDVAKGVKWGLGWGIQDTNPHQSFWHWGSMGGFKHYVVAYPEEQVGVVVMANSKQSFKIVSTIMATSIGGAYPSYDWF